MSLLVPREAVINSFFIFCGLGGGKKGFLHGTARVGHVTGRVQCLGGVDSDPASIADFDRVGPGTGTVLDLFSAEQYERFHGRTPPAGWREATPDDIRRAAQYQHPHIIFGSAPCKGFSGLLSEKASSSGKYQALNELALRGLRLTLEAFQDDPVEFWLWENVPRIQTRGRVVLDEMIELYESFGYVANETTHDCGELGGLGQHRNRFLLVCRHREKVPPFLYQPPKRRVCTVGEVLGDFPLPDDPAGGAMHRMRRLQRKTWERLAFVRAGSDWRSLKDLQVENGVLKDYALMPVARWHNGALGVTPWDAPSCTVTGTGRPMNGAFSVADPRVPSATREGQLGVNDWQQPSRTVTGESMPTNGRFAVADPRPTYTGEYHQLGVNEWGKPTGTVSGQSAPGGGAYSVADPRYDKFGEHYGKMRVEEWDRPAHTVTGSDRVGSGALSVADPRPHLDERYGGLGVRPWNEPSGAIIGVRAPGQGTFSVADPRLSGDRPRFNNVYRVVSWDQASQAVTGGEGPSAGGQAVADPRPGYPDGAHTNLLRVHRFDEPSRCVTGAQHVAGGALSVADPRTNIDRQPGDHYLTSRNYGIVPWASPSGVISGAACHDNGAFSVADPRDAAACGSLDALAQLRPEDRLVMVIIALDGTWHRPFTTLELAALQGLVRPGEYLELHGTSDTAWRERIGNAVPPPAAEAIANMMVETLLLAWAGETFVLSDAPIWVQPLAIALSVDGQPTNGSV